MTPEETYLLFRRFLDASRDVAGEAFVTADREAPELFAAAMAAIKEGRAALALVVELHPIFAVSVHVQGVIDGYEGVQDLVLYELYTGHHRLAGHA